MNRIKELQEKQGAKKKEARALIQKATDEKRELSADELKKVSMLHDEAEAINNSIVAEARQIALEGSKPVHLSAGEKRDVDRLDYNRLLNHMVRSAKGTASGPLDGVERELVDEGEREARSSGIESGGIFLPRFVVRRERRDVSATGQTSVAGDQGGMAIATEKRGILDDFFSASVMRQAGATVIEGMVGNLDVTRIVAGTAAAKKTENATADEVSPTFAKASFTPQRLPAFIEVGEQLLKQTSEAIATVLKKHLGEQMLDTQEKAFFHGTGTSEAYGIAAVSGIGSVAGGTNGLAPAWSHIVGLETACDTNNALLGNLHYFSNGQIRGKLKQTPVVASTDSRMIIGDGGLLNGYTPFFTNAISRTLTKGTSSEVCSAIFFGNASDYWITYWGGVSLEMVRDATSAKAGQYVLVASAYYDGDLVRPKSFAAMLDALGA